MVSRTRRATVALVAALALIVTACSPGGSGSPSPAASRTALTVGLGFIPSVQFAPFYLADRDGYYRAAGLDVTFQNKIDPDLVTLIGQGAVDVGLADGTSVIPAVSQGIPIRYLATVYAKYPSIVFARVSTGIQGPGDLAGRKIGIPGRFGSSWIMLQALLRSAGLTPDDVEIVEYPDFGQGAAVQQGAVDAATGFVNNEPVQLELAGEPVVVLHVDGVVRLPGPGLIAGTKTIDAKPAALAAFVAQTLRAMRAIADNPEAGLDASIEAVPELAQSRDAQRAILRATVDAWQSQLTGREGLGAIDRDGWTESVQFMTDIGLVPNPVTLDGLIDARFLTVD